MVNLLLLLQAELSPSSDVCCFFYSSVSFGFGLLVRKKESVKSYSDFTKLTCNYFALVID